MLKVELIKEDFDENMKNKDSKEFQDMAERITTQVSTLRIVNSCFCFIITQKAQRDLLLPVNIWHFFLNLNNREVCIVFVMLCFIN